MPKPTPLILVGAGEYYQKILIPALKLLKEKGLAYPLLTIDIQARKDAGDFFFGSLEHRIRKPGESLSQMLQDLAPLKPVVILGHANQMHVSDTEDLAGAGFTVLLEKPFALSVEELSRLRRVVESARGKTGMVEYYLTMKSAPLFALTGQLDAKSFFFAEGLMQSSKNLPPLGVLGEIRSVVVEVLEGEGQVGRLDHRGAHLVAKKLGGGMIQDLGIHAFAPLVPLESWIGELQSATITTKTGKCQQYLEMAKKNFNLDPAEVAESYAEISLSTSKRVPVIIRIGKYSPNKNRKVLKVIGERGEIELDLVNPRVSVTTGESKYPDIFTLPHTKEKYYPVLRSSLLELAGRSPYTFSISGAALKAQELVLSALKASEGSAEHVYEAGAEPEEIFV
jgi:predicted dehydrogenase